MVTKIFCDRCGAGVDENAETVFFGVKVELYQMIGTTKDRHPERTCDLCSKCAKEIVLWLTG